MKKIKILACITRKMMVNIYLSVFYRNSEKIINHMIIIFFNFRRWIQIEKKMV